MCGEFCTLPALFFELLALQFGNVVDWASLRLTNRVVAAWASSKRIAHSAAHLAPRHLSQPRFPTESSLKRTSEFSLFAADMQTRLPFLTVARHSGGDSECRSDGGGTVDEAVFTWAIGKALLIVIGSFGTLVYLAWAVTCPRARKSETNEKPQVHS